MASRPHLVFFPFPVQGHITPAFQLARLLHRRHGFDITFVHTEHNRRRLLRAGGPGALAGAPGFRFVAVPDGLSPSDEDAAQDIHALDSSLQSTVPHLLSNLLLSSSDFAAAAAVVSDMDHCQQLIAKGLVPLIVEIYADDEQLRNGYLDNTVIDWMPGLPKTMRLRDFPSFIRTTDRDNADLAFTLRIMECHRTVPSAVIFHTFEELESQVLNAMSALLPPIYAVGPLPPLLEEEQQQEEDTLLGSSSLSKEDRSCLDWLDGNPPKSVVFVSVGSLVTPTKERLTEVAWGLANSGYHFLWVIRNDQRDELLPPGFLAETEGRGRVTSWCSQEAVLRHEAVGAFLTHCGWNSMLESLCAGVPMLCWPFVVDQQPNSRLACMEWRAGLEVSDDAVQEEVEAAVRQVMGEEEPRRSAMEWKEKVARATGPANHRCTVHGFVTRESTGESAAPGTTYNLTRQYNEHLARDDCGGTVRAYHCTQSKHEEREELVGSYFQSRGGRGPRVWRRAHCTPGRSEYALFHTGFPCGRGDTPLSPARLRSRRRQGSPCPSRRETSREIEHGRLPKNHQQFVAGLRGPGHRAVRSGARRGGERPCRGHDQQLRNKTADDPLFFKPLEFAADGMYATQIAESVSRMDVERVMLVAMHESGAGCGCPPRRRNSRMSHAGRCGMPAQHRYEIAAVRGVRQPATYQRNRRRGPSDARGSTGVGGDGDNAPSSAMRDNLTKARATAACCSSCWPRRSCSESTTRPWRVATLLA
ncbi:hypothetical protein PR202_ga22154 [Eleusine coracana subsp. coracana]|uniref:UDP-glycosyltransferases domain-containing protein n=1 Tax=Eleusine coracana subsp. coracana TaxID=191504 RepID=A0AAV5D2E8_ELECO|nr:hypothetical protein PR202_ga22154 [Eleusine coracana subsp. coracana]